MTGGRARVRSVLIVGSGLMGTSVGLALRRRGIETHVADHDPAAARLAADLGAGRDALPSDPVDIAILAVPPMAVVPVLLDLQGKRIAHTYMDLASTKAYILRSAALAGCDLASYLGGHPMAGRERPGAGAARADLFQGRPWVLAPSSETTDHALAAGWAVAEGCGAVPVVMSADDHDRAVALISHVPQVLASLMAARLADASDAAVALAGQGVRDVTRVAASDTGMWREILATNTAPVAEIVHAIAVDLARIATELGAAEGPDTPFDDTVGLLARGKAGEARLPGKHGTPHATYAVVPVILHDRPGQLARLFTDAGEAGVNIEDVRIEHSPGQPVGLVELAVHPAAADELTAALRGRGWTVH